MTAKEIAENNLKWAEEDLRKAKDELNTARLRLQGAEFAHSKWQRELSKAIEDEIRALKQG